MGFFSFLKKKDKGEAGLTPVPPSPDNLKGSLQNSNVPPIDDIPMPPKPDDVPPPESSTSEIKTDTSDIDIPPPPVATPAQQPDEPVALEPTPVSQPEAPFAEEKKELPDIEEPKEEKKGDFDFSLPDFSEDELKMDAGEPEPTIFEQPEEKTPELKEFQVGEEKKEEAKTEEQAPSATAQTTEVKSEPVMKTETPVASKSKYISVYNCNSILRLNDESQTLLERTTNAIQKNDVRKRSWNKSFGQIHDALDNIQERMMDIDNSLFER